MPFFLFFFNGLPFQEKNEFSSSFLLHKGRKRAGVGVLFSFRAEVKLPFSIRLQARVGRREDRGSSRKT